MLPGRILSRSGKKLLSFVIKMTQNTIEQEIFFTVGSLITLYLFLTFFMASIYNSNLERILMILIFGYMIIRWKALKSFNK